MSNTAFFARAATSAEPSQDARNAIREFDAILALARESELLITLDGQMRREKYQSIAGSLHAFKRFAEALCDTVGQRAPV
ncbi:hypothetical protein [Paraburkholderia sp. 40]|uniref:hypothetical protein n=1 Tax=Paraburkholderia sp. 40 TaxID=2991059 RepID=UPI003D1B40B5